VKDLAALDAFIALHPELATLDKPKKRSRV
jgi:hypothetical protein